MLMGMGFLGFVGALAGKDFRAGSLGGFPIPSKVGRVAFFISGLICVFASLYMP
jgi:hypothetical protein